LVFDQVIRTTDGLEVSRSGPVQSGRSRVEKPGASSAAPGRLDCWIEDPPLRHHSASEYDQDQPAMMADDRPDQDKELTAAVRRTLASLPRRECEILVSLLDLWHSKLTWRQRALLSKTLKPDLIDQDVALLAGVTRRSLLRCPEYSKLKTQLRAFGPFPLGFKDENGSLDARADDDDGAC
jgi:hypothetical protein